MNYFAHGRAYVDQPYFLAGTAVPDWLNVANRKAKARAKTAEQFSDDSDPVVAGIAAGIMQHHHDDSWFHGTRAFVELSMEFAIAIRERLNHERGFRAGFLGHVFVELLLDACLIEEDPSLLDAYYASVRLLDARRVSQIVNCMTTQPAPLLEPLIPRFQQERFLYDYLEDDRLLCRMNQVMRRVKLAPLPETLLSFISEARVQVRARQEELLTASGTAH